ncbi:MAG: HpaII family restriction endonuclease [bacterium]|nr:HpaII family restriction endonuclease [bacterium]
MSQPKIHKVNKGEWSEFYTLLKLLAEQRLYAADENLEKMQEIFYPVLKVIEAKGTDKETHYELNEKDDDIKVFLASKDSFFTVSKESLKSKIKEVFLAIKNSNATFAIPVASKILDELKRDHVKTISSRKSDIVLVIHDMKTGTDPEVGFSIKSRLGGASTILNSSGATNFTYKVEGFTGNIDEINSIVSSSKVRERIKLIEEKGGELKYHRMDSPIFESNVRKIDSNLPEILAEVLKIYFAGEASTMPEICELIKAPGLSFTADNSFFEYKSKEFLLNIALGMMPNTLWDGHLEAHGGYIIVREDGEIVCYHIYNLDRFRGYLFDNTKLDTPSTTKHGFGKLYKDNGELFFKLNLQIRFIK